MATIRLIRDTTSDQGTFGKIYLEETGEYLSESLELPDRDNMSNKSCILPGDYKLTPWNSRKFPRTLYVHNTPGRSAILIHSANFAGNTDKGLKTHLLGCIAPGNRRGVLEGQQAILASRPALRRIVALKPNRLIVEWA